MTVAQWRSEQRQDSVQQAPWTFPEHLVEALIATIEAAPESYPSNDWWSSIRRQALALREQSPRRLR